MINLLTLSLPPSLPPSVSPSPPTSPLHSFDDYLWNVTPECVTRVFPKERLVYLSPDSPNVLTEYSHEDVYILGALIDKRIPKKYDYDSGVNCI